MSTATLAFPLLAAALTAAWPARSRADDPPPKNEISLGWAPRVVIRKDLVDSPLRYVGPALGAAVLRYSRVRDVDAHRVETDFLTGTLRAQPDYEYLQWPDGAPQSTEGSPITYVRLKYAYLRSLPLPAGATRSTVRLGPALDFDVNQTDWVHMPNVIGGYFGAFALDARLEGELRVSPKHRLRAEVSLPLFAWVTRSPYSVTDDVLINDNRDQKSFRVFFRYISHGSIQTWNTYQAVRVAGRHDWAFRPHWALSTSVHMRMLANQVPRPKIDQEYGLTLALTARF